MGRIKWVQSAMCSSFVVAFETQAARGCCLFVALLCRRQQQLLVESWSSNEHVHVLVGCLVASTTNSRLPTSDMYLYVCTDLLMRSGLIPGPIRIAIAK